MKKDFNKKLNDLRLILIVFALITPLSYFTTLKANSDLYDPLWVKFVFSSIYIIFLFGTYFINFIKKHHYPISVFLIYLILGFQVFIMIYNNFERTFTGGYIFFAFLAILYLRTLRSMFTFSIGSVLIIIILYIIYSGKTDLITAGHIRSIIIMAGLATIIRYYGIRKEMKLSKFSSDLENSEVKFRNLLEFAPDAIISVDCNGNIKEINKKGIELIEIKNDKIIGQSINEFISDTETKNNNFFNDLKAILRENKSIDLNKIYYVFNQSNNITPIELSFGIIEIEDNLKNYIAIFRDVSQRINAEKEINDMRVVLQQKELTEKLSKAKSEFISRMSHEIRTPLNSIYGFTNILLNKNIDNEERKYIETIKFSSELLTVLINDILDNANLETGNISLEENNIDLNRLINNVVASFNIRLIEKKLKIDTFFSNSIKENNFHPIGDSLRISQIIMNLLSNAIKFSYENGQIELKVNLDKYENNLLKLSISVTDYGIGIPKNQLDEIFQPFVQVSSEISKKYGGNGLGLSIVKNLIDKIGGKIWVSSDDKTTFNVELYLKNSKKSNAEKIILSKTDYSNIKNIKLLIVEDNMMNQFLMKTVLDKYEIKYDVAENGIVALNYLENKKYDLILMDLMMPIMDGYECADKIKNELKLDCKIFALTADVESVAKNDKLINFDSYIKKPFEEDELIAKIENSIENSKI